METYNLINANIITMFDKFPSASSLIISNGKILSINEVNNKYPAIDLKGATVIPGFIDAHYHLKNYGKRLSQVNLKNANSKQEIIVRIKEKINILNKGDWILGFGWDQNLWNNKNFPTKDILNTISPNNPIYLTRIDGHSAWVNNKAIKKLDMDYKSLKNIPGGKIINECILIDNTMNPFKSILPVDSQSDIESWLRLAVKETIKKGITGVHDAWQDTVVINTIKNLIKQKEFPLRCYGMLASSDKELLKTFFQDGHYIDEYLSIRSVKAFIDGALGSRGAALHKPYNDDENNCGLILISQEEFSDLAQLCYKNNFQLNTHAIGDRGNDYVLSTYENVLSKLNDKRWRIEHAQMVSDEDIFRFKSHSILPSMQPSHCTSDMKWLPHRIGDNRLSLISRWQSFINQNIKIPGGSDCPIEEGNPILEFYYAITRQDEKGWPSGGWQPQEKITRINALKMFTQWAAFGGFDESTRGMIHPGYDADLTILTEDILNTSINNILQTEILFTIVNGNIVYKKV